MYRGFTPDPKKQIDSIYDWIYSQHRRRKIPQAEVAKVLGVTREDYGYKLRNQRLTLNDFVWIMDFFGEDATACIK